MAFSPRILEILIEILKKPFGRFNPGKVMVICSGVILVNASPFEMASRMIPVIFISLSRKRKESSSRFAGPNGVEMVKEKSKGSLSIVKGRIRIAGELNE